MNKSVDTIQNFLSRVTGFSISTPLGGIGLSWTPAPKAASDELLTKVKERPVMDSERDATCDDGISVDPNTSVESFFWLAQTLVGWSISGMELAYQQFEVQARLLSITVERDDLSPEEFLSRSLKSIDDAIRSKHGEAAVNIFRFGSLVSLLPLSFNNQRELRNLKATVEKIALRFFGTNGFAATTQFLSQLPCDIPAFAERVEQFKKSLKDVVSKG